MVAGRLVVFGGSGFVGSAICKRCIERGYEVVAINRKGRPTGLGKWADKVNWVQGDALKPETYTSHLKNAAGVAIAIGLPPIPMDYEKARLINGVANVRIIEEAASAGVPKLFLVNACLPFFAERIIPGYTNGKQMALDAARMHYADRSAVVVKPSVVSGTRRLSASIPIAIPLWLLYIPLQILALFRSLFMTFLPSSLVVGIIEPPTPIADIAQIAASVHMYDAGVKVLEPTEIKSLASIWRKGS